jgi:hypothetical protein
MATQYPTWRYHAELPPRVVYSEEQDNALGSGWFDSPALAADPVVPVEAVDAEAEPVIVRRTRTRKPDKQ